MPFNLKKFARGLGKVAVGVAGSGALSFLPGGALITAGAKFAGALRPKLGAGITRVESFFGPGGASTALAPSRVMPVGTMMGAVGAMRAGAGLILRQIQMNIGKRISRVQIRQLIRRVGPEAAAVALGVSVAELIQVDATTPARRARGISARDIRRTKSTLRKLSSLACSFTETTAAVRPFARKRKCA